MEVCFGGWAIASVEAAVIAPAAVLCVENLRVSIIFLRKLVLF
jgi:hypothetical protein